MRLVTIALCCALAAIGITVQAQDKAAESAADGLAKERTTVESRLSGQTNQIILAVNGLCCRSCAIGIGKKVCGLDFVDTNSLPRGVKVDRKNSLLTVSVKNSEMIDPEALSQAIRKAGYDPVRIYQNSDDGTLKVTDIPAAE
jgi:hypothetical protein